MDSRPDNDDDRPPPLPGEEPDIGDFAPYMSSGGHTPYVFPGRLIQETNFLRGWAHRRGAVGWMGRVFVWAFLALIVVGIGGAVLQLLQ